MSVRFECGDNDITIPIDNAIKEGAFKWGKKLKDATLYLNMATVIRNVINAADDKLHLKADEIKVRAIKDITNFASYMDSIHNCKVIVYRVDYRSMHLPRNAKRKTANTPLQKINETLTVQADNLLKRYVQLTFTGRFVIPNGENRFILSHMAIDLLNLPSNVKLLESHTGTIKTYAEFNTKLNIKPNERVYVPFNAITLFTFGDGDLIAKQPKDFCKRVLDLCMSNQISPITTLERLRFVIQNKMPALNPIVQSFK